MSIDVTLCRARDSVADSPPLEPVRAVLFDFYGTLTTAVQRGPAHAAIARSLGCDPAGFCEVLDRTFYARAGNDYGPPVDALGAIAASLGAYPSLRRLRRAASARIPAVRADVNLRPGVAAVLRALRRRGLRTAVVSDCWYELPAFLPRLPIAPLFDARVYSFDVGLCKPHPAMFLTACERLGVPPAQCLYVGDGGSQELSGARRVGMTAIRLAADDLSGHLVYRAEPDWPGLAVTGLTGVLDLLDRFPALI